MRLTKGWSCRATLLLFFLAVSSFAHPSAFLQSQALPEPKLRPQRTYFNSFRDAVIHRIWGKPASHKRPGSSKGPETTFPSNLRALYGNDVVLRFKISTRQEAEAFAEAARVLFLDVWEFTPEWADVRLARDVVSSLLGLLPQSMQRSHTPLMYDLVRTIYESYPSPHISEASSSPHETTDRSFTNNIPPSHTRENIFFRDYQPLSVILPWMRLMQSLFPTHVRLVKIGTSFEGRDIMAFRVGVRPANLSGRREARKTIIISGGSHAREWISTSTVNYVAYSMITAYGGNRQMTKLLEEFDWIFIPTLNPDGYTYTWEHERLWRKNRQTTTLQFCPGLDIDRSFGYQWDGEYTRGNPCSESFSGDVPFQAAEAIALSNWVRNETSQNNATIVGFLDLHSYSQQVLYPFSFSCVEIPSALEDLIEVGLGLSKAIHQAGGHIYGVTSACEGSVLDNGMQRGIEKFWPRVEESGGTALDWAHHEAGVKFTYQLKLRDTGSYGFLLPRKNIIPAGEEILSAVKYFGNYLLSNRGVETIDDSPSSESIQITTLKPEGLGSKAEEMETLETAVEDLQNVVLEL